MKMRRWNTLARCCHARALVTSQEKTYSFHLAVALVNICAAQNTFPDYIQRLTLQDSQTIILQLLEALRQGGLVEVVRDADEDDQKVPGYQLLASSMRWVRGDGLRAFHDPI